MSELIIDTQNPNKVKVILDEKERVLEKNVYYYDDRGRVSEVRKYDMIRRGTSGDREIPIRVNTYEYD